MSPSIRNVKQRSRSIDYTNFRGDSPIASEVRVTSCDNFDKLLDELS
jgi:hypothetical protein